MPKKAGIVFVMMGAVLILSALLLFLYNSQEDTRAGQEAELLLADIQLAIEEEVNQEVPVNGHEPEPTEGEQILETLPESMPVKKVGEYDCVGILKIPSLELELPVLADWDYKRLKTAPCRHFGSSRSDDLVIAAHNYKSHFGKLSSLPVGASVVFIDMKGIENHYELKVLSTLEPDAVDEVLNSGYDLVLYTCTPGGATRVVAFFDRIQDEDLSQAVK